MQFAYTAIDTTWQQSAQPWVAVSPSSERLGLDCHFLILIALLFLPLAGVRSAPIWICYMAFVVLYALWGLRLDCPLLSGPAARLPAVPHRSRHSPAPVRLEQQPCRPGVARTDLRHRAGGHLPRRPGRSGGCAAGLFPSRRLAIAPRPPALSRRARARHWSERCGCVWGCSCATGSRFALVVLRVVRFEEAASYYGEESSQRILAAVSRRGLRLLGPDAQHFLLPGGRVAFLFETESRREGGATRAAGSERIDPPDIEGLAMSLGRKACEHLVDGHRVECVVGWASAPADGL